ncbi:MAG: eukaryotic-like serine/threonine-protein kinase, partial [Solirubrobacteraceae bacterium]|nr:eukaryotic-like serine/threonine-protein kinase [Solirubrobacteraceae bacterium]
TVPAASGAAEGLPRAVDSVLRAGMAKDPADRPGTSTELVDHLERALGAAVTDEPTAVTRRFTPVSATPSPARAAAARPSPPTTASGRAVREPRAARTPPPPATPASTAGGGRRGAWIAALAALALAAGAVAAIAMSSAGGGGGSTKRASTAASGSTATTPRKERTQSTASAPAASTTTATAQSTASTQPKSTAPTSGTADPRRLNDQGFSLIQQGDPASAVPLLRQSVQGFRDSGRTSEINYAFALFNLASALRATGHPDEAIPLLEERLRVSDYKVPEVQRELALSRRQAGAGGGASSSAPGKGATRGNGGGGNGNGNGGDGGDCPPHPPIGGWRPRRKCGRSGHQVASRPADVQGRCSLRR